MKVFTYDDYVRALKRYRNIREKLKSSDDYLLENKINNEHDKTFKIILSNTEKAVNLINRTIKLKHNLKPEDIEKYSTEFVTNDFRGERADIVFKEKNRDVFYLIEHQSRIDYAMPWRILDYQIEIMRSFVKSKNLNRKRQKHALVIAIVLYSGNRVWDAKKYINAMQEKINPNDKLLDDYRGLGNYNLVDINDYTEKELLESESFLDKILLLEKAKSTEDLIKKIEDLVPKIQKHDKKDFKRIVILMLTGKLPKEVIRIIIENIEGGKKDMLAVYDMMRRETKMYINRGRKEGRIEGRKENQIEIAKKMLNDKMKIEDIKKFTGLTEKEIKNIKN